MNIRRNLPEIVTDTLRRRKQARISAS